MVYEHARWLVALASHCLSESLDKNPAIRKKPICRESETFSVMTNENGNDVPDICINGTLVVPMPNTNSRTYPGIGDSTGSGNSMSELGLT